MRLLLSQFPAFHLNLRRGFGRRWLWEALFLTLVLTSIAPLWVAQHLPLEDLPQHLAAITVLHDFHRPAFRFDQFFELTLGNTQYLSYYFGVHLLAYVFGVELANCIVLSLAIGGLPYALRGLLRVLGREPAWALFALPLTYNAHLILGFLNFVAALPLVFWGLALAVKERLSPSRARAVGLAVVALLTFYTHVVPFAFLALGMALIAWDGSIYRSFRRALPLVPAVIAMGFWVQSTAGRSVVGAAAGQGHGGGLKPTFQDWGVSLQETTGWLTAVFPGATDTQLLILWMVTLLATFALGAGGALRTSPSGVTASLTRRIAVLAPIAGLAYFVAPTSYEWIWPINARFPLLALLFVPIALPHLPALSRFAVVIALSLLSLRSFREVVEAFRAFEEKEVGHLEQAIAAIPPGKRVAGLIWDPSSANVKYSPFLHAVAWYQVRRGGAVMFTFAEFPQSPFHWLADRRPPSVRRRWEWLPQEVDPAHDLNWYDFVLTRRGPGNIASLPAQWERVYNDGTWAVWHRTEATSAN
jgi:hypothetical protein